MIDSAISSANLDTGSVDVPLVDAVVTGDDDGRIIVAVVNKSDSSAGGIRVRIGGVPVTGRHRAVVLTGATPDSYNDVESPDEVQPAETEFDFADGIAEIPAHSVVVCTIDGFESRDSDDFAWSRGTAGMWTQTPSR